MYSSEEFENLEQEERIITDEALTLMLALISTFNRDLEKELREFYQKYGKDGVVTYAEARKWINNDDHRRRLTALLLLVDERFATLVDDIEPHFESFLRGVIDKELGYFKVDGNELDIDTLAFLVWGADSLNWLSRLHDNANVWVYHITSTIKKSLLQQKNIESIIEELTNRCDSMKRILTSLGLTESTAIGSATRIEIFKKLGVTKYRFYTKVDERRCETCGAMHGLVFPVSAYEIGVTASPCHPRCRCWEEPLFE